MKLPVAKLNNLSLRRTQLMGVATLMILYAMQQHRMCLCRIGWEN